MSLITITDELRRRLPKLSPFYGKTITKNVSYDGTNMVIDGTGVTGTEISFSNVIIRADVIDANLLEHNGLSILELEFNGFLPIVYDKKEIKLATVDLVYRDTNEVTTFPVYDIDNQTNKLYLRWGAVPSNVNNLSYVGTNHYVNKVFKEGVSFSRSGNNILIPTEQFSSYAFAQAKINTELYISFYAREQLEDNRAIQAKPKSKEDTRCLVMVIPDLERVLTNENQQVAGSPYITEGDSRFIRYVVMFHVILAVYGAWDNMSKGAMYKFLEDRKQEVDSLLTGFKPIDLYTKMPVESACLLVSSRYGNLDGIKGTLSCELRYQYTYRSTDNTYLADMADIININNVDLVSKVDLDGSNLIAENVADEQLEPLLNEQGSYLYTEESNFDSIITTCYKDYLANLPNF
jgi:hypothetical protein